MNVDLEPPDSKAGTDARSRRPEVDIEIKKLKALDRDQLLDRLRQAAREKDLLPEVALHFVRVGHGRGDEAVYWTAFEALVKVATPMLASRMRKLYGMKDHDLEDHQQMIFTNLMKRVQDKDKGLDYGERNFASFLLRRSIDAMRSSSHPWAMSVKLALAEALRLRGGDWLKDYDSEANVIANETDPREHNSAWDPEARAQGQDELDALQRRLAHLPEKEVRAFFLSQVLQRTHPQIAEQLGASERSVRSWIANVAKAVGQRNKS